MILAMGETNGLEILCESAGVVWGLFIDKEA